MVERGRKWQALNSDSDREISTAEVSVAVVFSPQMHYLPPSSEMTSSYFFSGLSLSNPTVIQRSKTDALLTSWYFFALLPLPPSLFSKKSHAGDFWGSHLAHIEVGESV